MVIHDCKRAMVLGHEQVSPGVKRITLYAPQIAKVATPGQFVNVKCSTTMDPLLRRPFSLNRINREDGTIGLLYKVVGRGTELMSQLRVGDAIQVLGPLGRGFTWTEGLGHALLIAGGIGVAPLYPLAQSLVANGAKVTCLFGARCSQDLADRDELAALGVIVSCCTEDGSCDTKGLVTDLMRGTSDKFDCAFACGPNPMLAALKELCSDIRLPLQVSLEQIMACGLGVCLGCTCEKENETGYWHVCSDGPVLWAEEVKF